MIPTNGINANTEAIIDAIIIIIIAIIINAKIFRIPIFFISSNISPKLNAAPNSSALANLANAMISKIAKMMNTINARTPITPNAATTLSSPAPIAPVIIARINVIIKGIKKYTILITKTLIPSMKLFTGSISGISSACPTAFLITLNPKPERINAKIKLITIPINNTAPLSTPNVGIFLFKKNVI